MVANAIKRESKAFNKRRPEVIVIANESDPRLAQQILAQKQEESDQSGDEGYEYPSRRESRVGFLPSFRVQIGVPTVISGSTVL